MDYSNDTYGGAPDECNLCWPHKKHDGKPCKECHEATDLGCRDRGAH